MKKTIFLLFLASSITVAAQKRNSKNKAIFLEDISWNTAKSILTPEAVVVIPLGSGAKEHGPHLPLSSDFIQAEGCKNLLALERKVFIAPTVNYGFYPAFIKYAGSTSMYYSTSAEMIIQIVRSLSNYGPKRFYIINIGLSTTPTLESAAKVLAEEGILLYYSNFERQNFKKAEQLISTKSFAGHADEIETSNVLSLRPDLVNMKMAVDDSSMKNKTGIMSPILADGANINTSGINGYASLGTKEKGNRSMKSFTEIVIKEIDSISTCALPEIKDGSSEYIKYEGVYVDSNQKKLIIYEKDKLMYFVWNAKDSRFFSHLYRDSDDYFTSPGMNILFVKDEKGEVVKAWVDMRGAKFWVKKQ